MSLEINCYYLLNCINLKEIEFELEEKPENSFFANFSIAVFISNQVLFDCYFKNT
jgi:hypothetical protein